MDSMLPDDSLDLHIDDLAFDALDAESFRELAQEFRVQAGVDVKGVVHAAARQMREAALERSAQFEAVVAVVGGQLAVAALQPEMLKARGPVVLARRAEGVDVVLAAVAPVLEADAELESALRGGHELLLVDLQQAMESHERRNGRFADAHGTDLVGLDQPDVEQLAERFRQPRGHHPARRATAGDHHAANAVLCLGSVLHVHPSIY